MQIRSRGVVLHYFKYSEGSAVVKVLTKELGLYSCFAKKISGKKSKTRIGLLQPLSLINITAKQKKTTDLPVLNEISLANPSVPVSIEKKFIFMFIAEVLTKVLRPGERDEPLFNYIWDLRLILEGTDKLSKTTSVVFLIELSKLLGFGPDKKPGNYFDMETAEFVEKKPLHCNIIEGEELYVFRMLLIEGSCETKLYYRSNLLNSLLKFYEIHGHKLKGLNTHVVINSLRK